MARPTRLATTRHATQPHLTSRGIGARLVQYTSQVLRQASSVRQLWCNARVPAIAFYQQLGWQIASEEFTVGVYGPHKKMTATGQVVLKAEKAACRAFPDPKGDGIASGPKRNFQILSPLDFLAEFTQHIPPKGSPLIRYYRWYSNKARGMRRKAEAAVSSRGRSDRIVESTGQSLQPYLGRADQAGL